MLEGSSRESNDDTCVRVAIRIRPLSNAEINNGEQVSANEVNDDSGILHIIFICSSFGSGSKKTVHI